MDIIDFRKETYVGTKLITAWPEERDGKAGYGVMYEDGYESWSPFDAFVKSYQSTILMDFSSALFMLKRGSRISRRGWNGPDQWVSLQEPDEHSKMRRPYFYMSPVDGELVPWVASVSDILADDWYVVLSDVDVVLG